MAGRNILLVAVAASFCLGVHSQTALSSVEPPVTAETPVSPTMKRTVDLYSKGTDIGNSQYIENLQDALSVNSDVFDPESLSIYGVSQINEVLFVKNYMICMQIWIHFFTQAGTPYFYQVQNNGEVLELMLNVKPNGVYFSLVGEEYTVEKKIQPAKWYQLCFIRNTQGIIIVWDKEKIKSISKETNILPFNGVLVLGNNENYSNDTTRKHNFVGKLSSLFALLSNEDILAEEQGINICNIKPKKHELPMPLNNLCWKQIGNSASYSEFDPCTEDTASVDIVFPYATCFDSAETLCELLGLQLPFIDTVDRSNELAEILKQSYDVCTMSLSNHRIGWILNDVDKLTVSDAITPNEEFDTENFLELDKQNQNYNISTNDKYHTVLLSSKLLKFENPEAKACPICTGKSFHVEFRLYGLCSQNSSAILFHPRMEKETKFLYFHSNIDLVMKFSSNSWIIQNNAGEMTIATLPGSSTPPIGRRDWKVGYTIPNCNYYDSSEPMKNSDTIDGKEVTNSLRTLTFSSCNEDKFVCNDGSCIAKSKRCSRKYDCLDRSDELQCNRIDTKSMSLYDSMMGPNKESFALDLNATLLKIGSVDIVSRHASIQMMITMQWEENRLNFLNVQENMLLNFITDKIKIWTPNLMLTNKDELEGHVEPKKSIYIRKIAESKLFNGYDNVFNGEDVEIHLEITYTSKVNCIFFFHFYPFDTQNCLLEFTITNSPANFLNLSVSDIRDNSIEQQVPLEYALSGTKIWFDGEKEKIFYEFQLTRYLMFPFLSIYVPTFMMLLISYGTLCIPVEDFQDRGTMSLTTLLVLISQYTQTLNNLPVTVYVKIVDWWYLFCVLYLSVIIFVHLMTSNVNRIKIIKSSKRLSSIPDNDVILKCSRGIFLAILVVFQVVYWLIVAFYLLLQSTKE